MDRAITNLKERFKAKHLELVGYSGGAAIALLIAEERTDVTCVITVAGNVEPHAWAVFHNVSPLAESLDPRDNKKHLMHIEQYHFVGGLDGNTPPQFVNDFAKDLPRIKIILMKDYDHVCCWAQNWPVLWSKIE